MIELAKLDNGELIYGTYEECEAYADKVDSWVIKYMEFSQFIKILNM